MLLTDTGFQEYVGVSLYLGRDLNHWNVNLEETGFICNGHLVFSTRDNEVLICLSNHFIILNKYK